MPANPKQSPAARLAEMRKQLPAAMALVRQRVKRDIHKKWPQLIIFLAWPVICGLFYFWLAGGGTFALLIGVATTVSVLIAEALIVFVTLLYNACLSPAANVHRWALEQAQDDTIQRLSKNATTQEDLQTLLDYHLSKGNIEVADKISQKLMALVDKDAYAELSEESETQGETIKPKSALPDWMSKQDGEDGGQNNLPGWMKK
jgi:hypothetical protein